MYSANLSHNSVTLGPIMSSSNPCVATPLRCASVVWFHKDLRIHDNECLTTANNEALSVLPVYCFDPRDYGKSPAGFDKTGLYRAKFLVESVADLRKNLQDRGSDLVVRVGRPENVLLEMVKAVGADAVYVNREVSHDEVVSEEKIEEMMKDEGVEVKYFWGSTLYHLEDLPFQLDDMPTNYGGFKEKVKGLPVRKKIQALEKMKDLPKRGDVEPGVIPSLLDLGLDAGTTVMDQNVKFRAAYSSLVGGETEALQRLINYAAEYKAIPYDELKDDTGNITDNRNIEVDLSPWLAMGCLSPRFMYEEVKNSVSSSRSDLGTDWYMLELVWRDFFRFITRKYSTARRRN